MQFDGEPQHLLLQGTDFRRVFRLGARFLPQSIDFQCPPVLVRLLPQFGPFGARLGFRGRLFGGLQAALQFSDIGWQLRSCGLGISRGFLTPDLKHALGFAGRTKTLAQRTAQCPSSDATARGQQVATGTADVAIE